MENAMKALIMAATTILGVLLLYIMIYMFRSAARVDQQYDENQAQRSLELKNSEFEVYNTEYNSIMDLITVCNLAHSKNLETEYDIFRRVKITININGKKFEIPNERIDTEEIEKPIFLDGKPMSIYRLADSTLEDLKISVPAGGKKEDKLSRTHTGKVKYKKNKYGESMWKCKTKGCTGTSFDPVEMDEYVTTYKYLFKCTKINYHDRTNVVSEMEFELIKNSEISDDSILKWNSAWD